MFPDPIYLNEKKKQKNLFGMLFRFLLCLIVYQPNRYLAIAIINNVTDKSIIEPLM